MQYNDLILFLFGIGGILIHNLKKIYELKQAGAFVGVKYFTMEWPAIAISAVFIGLAIMGKHEVAQLEQIGKWMGFAFFTGGYMGQSLLITIMGKAEKKINQITE